ncbi:MAG TPA: 4'-phosphopantetheinyl transferase superfamily protein, partial [Solirubrobacteraceae bacterium]|nr:4'-phosphopantetheinyl transferase superfamily protein [Solirubrobacteraceae bacterium]
AFAAQERAWWETVPTPARATAFLRAWTVKEAVLKAAGLGLAGGLEAVVTDAAGGLEAVSDELGSVESWTVAPLDVRDGDTAGAVALRQGAAGAVRVVQTTIGEVLR